MSRDTAPRSPHDHRQRSNSNPFNNTAEPHQLTTLASYPSPIRPSFQELVEIAGRKLEQLRHRLAPTMQAFFTDRMINQKNASPRTICAYRDTMRLLLTFATETTGTPPSRLDIEQLDAPLIGAFLDHLERDRGNSPRTRNARLAAIRSLHRYAALRHPSTRTRSRA